MRTVSWILGIVIFLWILTILYSIFAKGATPLKVEALTKTRELATIGSLVLIPLIVVWVQTWAASNSVSQQYVSLAVGILQSSAPAEDKTRETALRSWAVDVLTNNSPVDMSEALRQQLRDGEIRLSGFASSTNSGSGSIQESPDKVEGSGTVGNSGPARAPR
jgi:hypothetical protein